MFKFFKRRQASLIETYQGVFINIYEDIIEGWNTSGDLKECTILVDVSKFGIPVDDWVKTINLTFHIHNMSLLDIEAEKHVEESFFGFEEFLMVKLLNPIKVINGSIEA